MPPKQQQPKRQQRPKPKPKAKPRPQQKSRPAPNASRKQPAKVTTAPVAVAMSGPKKRQVQYESTPDMSSLRVRGCEPIFTLNSATQFQMAFDEYINPMNNRLFPLLCAEASLFDKWRPNSLRLIYVPKCPTSTPGQVGMVILPDSEAAEVPDSMIGVEYFGYGITSAAWVSATTQISRKSNIEVWYFTALNSEFTSSDIGTRRTMSNGVIQLFAQGGPAASVLYGTVYMEFDISFMDRRPPLVQGSAGTSVPRQIYVDITTSTPDLTTSTLSSIFGNPTLMTSMSRDILTGLGKATAAYTAVTATLQPRSNFLRQMPGTTLASFSTLFAAIAPTEHDEEKSEEFSNDRESTENWPFIRCNANGTFDGADGPEGPWTPLQHKKNVHAAYVYGDCACVAFVYNALTDTYFAANSLLANSTAAITVTLPPTTYINNSDVPVYISLAYSCGLSGTNNRFVQTTYQAFANDL
jgi:hypothetical protein